MISLEAPDPIPFDLCEVIECSDFQADEEVKLKIDFNHTNAHIDFSRYTYSYLDVWFITETADYNSKNPPKTIEYVTMGDGYEKYQTIGIKKIDNKTITIKILKNYRTKT